VDRLLNQAKKFTQSSPDYISKDQYFLVDQNVIDQLVKVADVSNQDRVLEIGPGLGFLTKALAKQAKKVAKATRDE